MQKVSSFSMMLMGTGFLILAYFLDNVYVKTILLVASIVLNILAVIKNFKEKKDKKL